MGLFEVLVEEIALEGLDGITLPTLWLRLEVRSSENTIVLPEQNKIEPIFWDYLCKHDEMDLYKIPVAREEPQIFDRFEGFDEKAAYHTACAPDELDQLNEIYPVVPVPPNLSVKGSCKYFKERENINSYVKNISKEEAIERFGLRNIVIVASQNLRNKVLGHYGFADNQKDKQYCLLERIGRSRFQGEIQSKLNSIRFSDQNNSHSSFITNELVESNLIYKQGHDYMNPLTGKMTHQILFQLASKWRELPNPFQLFDIRVKKILRETEDGSMSWVDLKKMMNIKEARFKKMKNKLLAKGEVKDVNKRLKNSNSKRLYQHAVLDDKDDGVQAVSNEVTDIINVKCSQDEVNDAPACVKEFSLITQCNRYVMNKGGEGCSQNDLQNLIRLFGKLEARHITRVLERTGQFKTVMVDKGSQREKRLIAKSIAHKSLLTLQMAKAKTDYNEIMKITEQSVREQPELTVEIEAQMGTNNQLEAAKVPAITFDDFAEQIKNVDENEKSEVEKPEEPITTVALVSNSIESPEKSPLPISDLRKVQTAKSLQRQGFILQFMQKHKVVEGTFLIKKEIQEKELELYPDRKEKLDKKTLMRYLEKLEDIGQLAFKKVEVEYGESREMVKYVISKCATQKDIEKAKHSSKFRLYMTDYRKQSDLLPTLSNKPTSKVKEEDLKKMSKLFTDKDLCRKAKFGRAKLIHEYIWYLAYGHPDQSSMHCFNERYTNPTCSYNSNWKRYLPPIPSDEPGWLTIRDLIAQLPLSILCSFHDINVSNALIEYLTDSDKINFLVRQLPLKTENIIPSRDYLNSFYDTLDRLCFMGLISQRTHRKTRGNTVDEKVYVHRKLKLKDTSTSKPQYNKVSLDQEYVTTPYYLDKFEDVENYWYDLQRISQTTKLNKREYMKQHSDGEEKGMRKEAKMKQFVQKHIKLDSSLIKDDGTQPGDGLGAAGFDSSLYVHLYRNWKRVGKKIAEEKPNLKRKNTDASKKEPKLKRLNSKLVKEDTSGAVVKSQLKSLKRKKPKGPNKLVIKKRRKQELMKILDKHMVDHVEVAGKRKRTKFSSHEEDHFLIYCCVTSALIQKFLNLSKLKNRHLTVVPWSFVCKLYFQKFPNADVVNYDSLRRRSHHLMHKSSCKVYVFNYSMLFHECISSITENEKAKIFDGFQDKNNEEEMENLYIKMLEFVQLKSQANEFNYDIPDSVNCIKNRLTVSGVYNQVEPEEANQRSLTSVRSTDDILKGVAENVVYCCFFMDDSSRKSQSSSIHIPDKVLEDVFLDLQNKGVVTKKQPRSCEDHKKTIYLPFHRRSYPLYTFYRMYSVDVIEDVVVASCRILNLMNQNRHMVYHRIKDAGFSPIFFGLYMSKTLNIFIDLKSKRNNSELEKKILVNKTPEWPQEISGNHKRHPIYSFDVHVENWKAGKLSGKTNNCMPYDATSKRDFNLDNIEQVLCGSNSIGMLRQNDLVQLTDEALVKLRAVKYEKENSQLHNHDNIASILLKVLERKTKDEPALGYPQYKLVNIIAKRGVFPDDVTRSIDLLVQSKAVYSVGNFVKRLVLNKHAAYWFVSPNKDENKFICRPWHILNTGEVQYRSAKQMFAALFEHIFNMPSCTIEYLLGRIPNLAQKVVLLEMIDILVNMKIVERKCRRAEHNYLKNRKDRIFRDLRKRCYISENDDILLPSKEAIPRLAYFLMKCEMMEKEYNEPQCTTNNFLSTNFIRIFQ